MWSSGFPRRLLDAVPYAASIESMSGSRVASKCSGVEGEEDVVEDEGDHDGGPNESSSEVTGEEQSNASPKKKDIVGAEIHR